MIRQILTFQTCIDCRMSQIQQRRMDMEDKAAKWRKLEHQSGLTDAPGFSSFHMEDLPEEIQHLVLSLLSLKEAARTSVVSRSWMKIWTRHPNLCFDGTQGQCNDEDSVRIKGAKFIDTVHSVIQQHCGIGLNKFRIRCGLRHEFSDHLDRWIYFATAAKAKIIDIDLSSRRITKRVYRFPLESLSSHGGGPFIESLFLKGVSVKPRSDICGFEKLTRLLLHSVQITGDFPGLLSKCFSLEDLEVIACTGVTDLNIPHQLNKLRDLLISRMHVRTVDFHVTGLTDFEYKGEVIPIALHGCSKLEKATVTFERDNNELWHAFTAVPSISAVKLLNMHAYMEEAVPVWTSQIPGLCYLSFSLLTLQFLRQGANVFLLGSIMFQVHMVTTRPACTFTNLRHLTCEIIVYTKLPNSNSELLKLAQYLAFVPQLETLQLHMMYGKLGAKCWQGEVTLEEVSCMGRLDHLKTVYMSGFRCYRAQVELLCGILDKGPMIAHVTIQPRVTLECASVLNMSMPYTEICRWARAASERFGKAITVARLQYLQSL